MNVTHLCPSISRQAGGMFEAVRSLALHLHQQSDMDIEVFGLEDEDADRDKQEWSPLQPEVFGIRGPSAFGYAPGLLPAVRNSRPDLIHRHGVWMYPSLASLRWSRETENPHMVSPCGMLDPWAVKNAWWKKRIAHLLYEGASLEQADCIHALNDKEAQAIREYGLENPVCVIPNGVKLPEADRECAPPWPEAIGSDARVLLFLGRIHPKKGVEPLIDAWAQACTSQQKDWHLAIVGRDDGNHETKLRRKARANWTAYDIFLKIKGIKGDSADHTDFEIVKKTRFLVADHLPILP